jgi:cystathionine gamma-synthase
MRLETLAIHAGRMPDAVTGALAPPIHLATTFERDADGGYPRGFHYARNDNPNRRALEQALALLDGGQAAAAFASGMAAAAAVFQTLEPGDHIVAPTDLYHGVRRLLRDPMARWGLETTFVDTTDAAAVEAAMRPSTRLVWVETPSNPLLRVTDVARVARIAAATGAIVVCDNTFATAVGQRPLQLGASLALYSLTKYVGGHSDLQAGAVVAREADGVAFERIRALQAGSGAVPAPFTCWLALRSLPTLPYRMRAHSHNAGLVARFLREHEAVTAVHYPGLDEHPGHDVAARQMALYGGMLSFRVHGGRPAALAVAAKVRLFTRATSLGGVESLIEHRASMEGPETSTPDDLLRVSIGLEHPDDLIADLAAALG